MLSLQRATFLGGAFLLFSLLSTFGLPRLAAQDVLAVNRYERIFVLAPMAGVGTAEDPRRPMFVPKPGDMRASGLMSFRFDISDNKKFALVELVAVDRKAFAEVFAAAAQRVDVKVFEKGKATRAEIVGAFGQLKANFDADKWIRAGR